MSVSPAPAASSTSSSLPLALRWAENPRRAMCVVLGLSLACSGVALMLNGNAGLGWHAAVRISAIVAFPLWASSFLASSLARLAPGPTTKALRGLRRSVGLAFSVALFVHMLCVLRLGQIEPEILEPSLTSVGGGIGFLLTFAMAATSNDAAIKRLGGKRWRTLHRSGQVYLAGVFFVTYLGRVADEGTHWPAFLIILSVIALRIAAALQSARLRSRTLPTE